MCHRKGHLESIVQIRQMMAEKKFLDAQLIIETCLAVQSDARHELLLLYQEALEAQEKKNSPLLVLELAEFESQKKNHDRVLRLIAPLVDDAYFIRTSRLKIKAAEDQGMIDKLYHDLLEFYQHQFKHQVPFIPDWLIDVVNKYFKSDFTLKLNALAVRLLLRDFTLAEEMICEMILSCMEKSSSRGVTSKLSSIGEILRTIKNKGSLEIYQNFCLLWAHGLQEKADYKKLIELIIFFDDFRFQVMILSLLHRFHLFEEGQEYAVVVRNHPDYDFVYLDKYFSLLKTYFIESRSKQRNVEKDQITETDLSLDEDVSVEPLGSHIENEKGEDEQNFLYLLKHQTYTSEQLCDLAVSFLQSEMPGVALKASELSISASSDDREYLKGCYLKLTSLLQLRDYRAALDTSLAALERARSREDVLSFLYGQAEAYIRLGLKAQAKKTLSKVILIDAGYRLAKERLEKL